MDGRTVSGQIGQTAGGVGRNIADALGKLHRSTPLLMSAVGSDLYGQFILDNVKHLNSIAVEIKEGFRTACYTTLIDKKGETRFGIGDMEIHDTINKEQVFKYQKHIENSSLLVMDGNIPEATIHFALEVANKSNIPVWYEPTDLSKADKPFKSTLWHLLSFITPNLAELKAIAKYLGNELEEDFSLNNIQKLLEQIKYLVTPLAKEIPVIMVTMGEHGVLMASHVKENEPVLNGFKKGDNKVYIRYYKPIKIKDVQNTSGAGDCTASGFISGALSGLSEPECVRIGLEAALDSLKSKKPVPDHFSVNSNCLHDFPSFTRI